jgi:hypothetical protein
VRLENPHLSIRSTILPDSLRSGTWTPFSSKWLKMEYTGPPPRAASAFAKLEWLSWEWMQLETKNQRCSTYKILVVPSSSKDTVIFDWNWPNLITKCFWIPTSVFDIWRSWKNFYILTPKISGMIVLFLGLFDRRYSFRSQLFQYFAAFMRKAIFFYC